MSCRSRHPRFVSPLEILLDYLVHSSSGWSHVSKVYSPRMGPKSLALEKFHAINKIKIKKIKNFKLRLMFYPLRSLFWGLGEVPRHQNNSLRLMFYTLR